MLIDSLLLKMVIGSKLLNQKTLEIKEVLSIIEEQELTGISEFRQHLICAALSNINLGVYTDFTNKNEIIAKACKDLADAVLKELDGE